MFEDANPEFTACRELDRMMEPGKRRWVFFAEIVGKFAEASRQAAEALVTDDMDVKSTSLLSASEGMREAAEAARGLADLIKSQGDIVAYGPEDGATMAIVLRLCRDMGDVVMAISNTQIATSVDAKVKVWSDVAVQLEAASITMLRTLEYHSPGAVGGVPSGTPVLRFRGAT